MDCEHKDYVTKPDVGWDIDEDGEERQHLDVCKQCGAKRLRCVHTKHGLSLGNWLPDSEFPAGLAE